MKNRRISLFPGQACRHHHRGRCLLEERRNPGWHEGFRCKALREMETAYDHFLEQSERFGLDEETALRVWRGRLTDLLRAGHGCSEYLPAEEDSSAAQGVMGCEHEFQTLCVRSLPVCQGVCRHYVTGREESETDGFPENEGA